MNSFAETKRSISLSIRIRISRRIRASEKAEYRFKAELERAVREGAIELWS